jgi:hypothetical protein
MLMRHAIWLVVGLIGLGFILPGCTSNDDDNEPGKLNEVLDGRYFYVDFSRAILATVSPDVTTRTGELTADGKGIFTYGVYMGSPQPPATLAYQVDSIRRIDGSSSLPGCTLGTGDFFVRADLDRTDDRLGLALHSRAATNMTVNDLVDSPTTNTRYHAVYYAFIRPGLGVVNGKGHAEIARFSDTQGGWAINLTLGNATTLTRGGSFTLSPDGALVAADLTSGRSYVGYAEPHGDWLVWIELDTSYGRVVSIDVLVREGSGMTDSALNGRFNLAAFVENKVTGDVDTRFGDITFDGRGSYYDLKLRDSFGKTEPPDSTHYKYVVSSTSEVTLTGQIQTTAYVTRNSARRWLVYQGLNPDNTVNLFFALKR